MSDDNNNNNNNQVPRWTKEDERGIQKQIITDYTASTDLPGATIIPSHRGIHGAQQGRDKRAPIPMIVDPDRADGGIVIIPSMLDDKQAVIDASQGGDASAAFESLAHIQTKKKEEDKPVAQRKKTIKKTTSSKPAPPPARQVKESKSTPEPVPPAEAETSECVPESSGQPIDMAAIIQGVAEKLLPSMQATMRDAATSPAFIEDIIFPALQSKLQAVASGASVLDEPTMSIKEEEETAPPPEEVVAPPKISVILTSPDGTKMSLRYHHVLETNDDVAVFVYDTSFQHGDRVYPKSDLQHPYGVEIRKGETLLGQFKALYMGVVFTFKTYEFQVLMKVPADDQQPEI